MNRRALAIGIAASSLLAIALVATSGSPPSSSVHGPGGVTRSGEDAGPEPAPPLALRLEDLDAPPELLEAIVDGEVSTEEPVHASDLVYIARARGTSRRTLLAAVAQVLRARLAPLPDHEALAALLDTTSDAGVSGFVLPTRFPDSFARDEETVRAVGHWLAAAHEDGHTLDEAWLHALAVAAGDGPSRGLNEALAARAEEPREATLGFSSVLRLDGGRLDGVADRDVDFMLLAHDIATEGHSPHEGLRPVIDCAIGEAELLNGGFSQLAVNEPDLSLDQIAAGYRAVGLDEVADTVSAVASRTPTAEDDTRIFEQLAAVDAPGARARHVRALLAR